MSDDTQGGLSLKGVAGPAGSKIAGNVDFNVPPEVYENMKAELERRSGGLNPLLEGMRDAVAVTSNNPMAMVAREKQKDEQRQQAMDMRLKIAAWEEAQKQSAADVGRFWGTSPAGGAGAAVPAQGGAAAPVQGGAEVPQAGGLQAVANQPSAFEQTISGLPSTLQAAARSLPKNVTDRDAIIKMVQDIEGRKKIGRAHV